MRKLKLEDLEIKSFVTGLSEVKGGVRSIIGVSESPVVGMSVNCRPASQLGYSRVKGFDCHS